MPVPPQSVRNAAKKALEDRSELPPSRRAGTLVGLARANQLAKGENVSESTLRRMFSYLLRAQENYRRAKAQGLDNKTSKAVQAYNLWGGPSALAWVKTQLNQS